MPGLIDFYINSNLNVTQIRFCSLSCWLTSDDLEKFEILLKQAMVICT